MARFLNLLVLCCIGFALPITTESFRVVAFYYGTWDVAHISFCREANQWFPSVAAANGFTYEATTDWSRLNDNYLATVDVVLFLDDKPGNANQRAAFQRYLERGGGAMSFHVSAFTTNANEWSWYHNTLLGSGNFQRNTWKPTRAIVQVENLAHPVVANLPGIWETQANEFYAFSNNLQNNPNIQILLSIHPNSFPLGTDPNQSWYSGYYPVVWANKNHRFIYANFGHNDIDYNGNIDLSKTFGGEIQNRFFINALKWLATGRKNQSPLIQTFQH